SFHHGLADDPADGERNVANHQSGEDAEGGIADQADNRSADPEHQAANKRLVAVLRQTKPGLFAAVRASEIAVYAVILRAGGDRFLASLAALRTGGACVFGGAKLRRRIGHAFVCHEPESSIRRMQARIVRCESDTK